MPRPPDILDLQAAEQVIRRFLSPVPLIRSYRLEKELGLRGDRRVWLKDYGWTPVGSFKVYGALYWMSQHEVDLKDRPVAAHSSGNFASGIAFAGKQYGKRVIIVMPDTAPKVKFALTKSFGAEVRTYEIATDHLTGLRDKMTHEIATQENALAASPYDDPNVIAGNGVGGLEIAAELKHHGRTVSHFLCAVSGGGLMAGHALAIHHAFPHATILGVEPKGADDFRQSLAQQSRVRIEKPSSICDGLLSYDVGEHNWPILQALVHSSSAIHDTEIKLAMKWLYDQHGLKTEPSGAITIAALLHHSLDLSGDGDIVAVLSGRNIDESTFRTYIEQ